MRYSVIALLGLVALCACSAKPVGEFGADACSNRKDDDGDQRVDCQDPDCYGSEVCRDAGARPVLRSDAGMDAGHPIPKMDASTARADSGATQDAGLRPRDAEIVTGDDAGDEDGGAVVPMCVPACAPTEECVGSATSVHCEAVSAQAGGTYKLSITSAVLSDWFDNGMCVDCPLIPFYCPGIDCQIDSFVTATLTRAEATTTLLTTSTIENEDRPMYTDPPVDVTIKPGDVLTLTVSDHSNANNPMDTVLFSCKPSLQNLPGTVTCVHLQGPLRLMISAKLE